ESDGRITDINGPGPMVSEAAQQALLDRLDQIAPGHDAVVIAGSLPQGISAQWLQTLIVRLTDLGLRVALDTSGEALRAALDAGPWLIKPNTEELAEVFGIEATSVTAQAQAASRLHAQGIEHVVISEGAEGV